MKKRFPLKFFAALAVVITLAGLVKSAGLAQKQDPRWFGPFQLSNEGSFLISKPELVADPYGFAHAFWAEKQPGESRFVINYARFDGTTWSVPIDIFVSFPDATMGFLYEPVISPDGTIHFFWTLNQTGPVQHFSAPYAGALNARNWTRHSPIPVPAFEGSVIMDSEGSIHLMLTNLFGNNPGLYYTRSDAGGFEFSTPRWLDPDIPPNYGGSNVVLRQDPTNGNLYVVWRYEEKLGDGALSGQQINYLRSIDGGATWSDFRIVDQADEEPTELRADGLLLEAVNNQVHIIWAGVSTTHREALYSLDGGETWKGPVRIFGSLHGGAGDTLVADGSGALHFLGQIRYPQGLYDITWDGSKWGIPSLVYLVSLDAFEPIGDRIHVHNVRAVARRGNQLVTLFTNSPGETQLKLYAMHRTLENVNPEEIQPTPLPSPSPTAFPTEALVLPGKTPTPTLAPFSTVSPEANFSPGVDLGVSILAVVLVMGLILTGRLLVSRRRR